MSLWEIFKYLKKELYMDNKPTLWIPDLGTIKRMFNIVLLPVIVISALLICIGYVSTFELHYTQQLPNYFKYPDKGFKSVLLVKGIDDLSLLVNKVKKMPVPPGIGNLDIEFSGNYKNPCWDVDGDMKCLPYFFVAGFAKCGTTDLYYKLNVHPDMLRMNKEPMFWSRKRFHRQSGISEYARNYGAKFSELIANVNQTIDVHKLIFCDGSPALVWDNRNTFQTTTSNQDPELLNVHYIKSILPNTKFVLIVRNPTARMYSDYLYFHNKDPSPAKFHKLIVDAIKLFKDCMESYDLSQIFCVYAKLDTDNPLFWRIRIGLYYVHTLQLLNAGFKLDQIHVIRLEDYTVDRVGELNSIFNFLGLSTLTEEEFLEDEHFNRTINTNKMGHEVILTKTRMTLDEFYRPYNQKLAHLLGDIKYAYID